MNPGRTPTAAEEQELHQQLLPEADSGLLFPPWAARFLCDAANKWQRASKEEPGYTHVDLTVDLMRLTWSYAILAERMGLDTDTIGRRETP